MFEIESLLLKIEFLLFEIEYKLNWWLEMNLASRCITISYDVLYCSAKSDTQVHSFIFAYRKSIEKKFENWDFEYKNRALIRIISYAIWYGVIITHENKTKDMKINFGTGIFLSYRAIYGVYYSIYCISHKFFFIICSSF